MWKWVVAAALLMGCSSPQYTQVSNPTHPDTKAVPVIIDAAFSIWERKEITDAISEWNLVFNGNFYMVDRVGTTFDSKADAINFIRIDASSPAPIKYDLKDKYAITFPSGSHLPSAMIYIDVDATQGKLHNVALHELGHSWGADHEDNTLMQAVYSGISCVDQATVIQVAREMRLDLSTMNYCK